MRQLMTLTTTELRLYLREPAALFFTLAFPLMILFVFGGIFGNDPDPMLGGRGSVDVSVPGYIAMVIGTAMIFGLPVTLGAYREQGILRRLRATPLRPLDVIAAHVVVSIILAAIGIVLLVLAGWLVYDLVLPAAPGGVVVATLLALLAFGGFGLVLGGIFATARTAQAVASAVYFPQLFLSGASFPRQLFPDTLAAITEWLPMTQIVLLVTDLWASGTWNWTAVAVLSAMLVVTGVIATRTFRWE